MKTESVKVSMAKKQGDVKVQGMGIFFLVMPLAQTWLVGHEYMCYVCEITLRTCDISEMSRQGRPMTWPLTGSVQNGLLPPKP